jgi:hypothetical protein
MISVEGQATLLWTILPHPSDQHVIRLFAKGGTKRFGDFARSPADILRFIVASPAMDIYVAPNPTLCTTGIRHTAADVTHWSWLLLDLDPVEDECEPMEAVTEALLWLGEWVGQDLNPTTGQVITLDSGRGAQAWIRLDDWPLADESEGDHGSNFLARKVARKTMGYWLKRLAEKIGTYQGCRLDSCVSDLPRVMRCPGTINLKTGRLAAFVNFTDQVHNGLAHRLVVGTPEKTFNELEPGELAPGTPWQSVYTKLTRKAQQYLTEGKEEPGRHETLWHVCKKLQEVGIDRNETRKALEYGNALLGPDSALPVSQIETVLEQVYGRT